MVAVTVVNRRLTGNMSMEVLKVTATDGYTYKSKFGTIIAAFANSSSRVGSWVSWSGSTLTYHCASASGDTVSLFIVGY